MACLIVSLIRESRAGHRYRRGAKILHLLLLAGSACLEGGRRWGKAFQFSRGIFLPYSSAKLGGRESWELEEEERVMNFKCLTWDLHDCLKRDLFINDKSF